MTPISHCPVHPNKIITLNCKSCDNHPICEECYTDKHNGHNIEDINDRIKILRNHLQTAKRNMDKINERCMMLNDENHNEESQIVTLFQKMQTDYKKKQDSLTRRLHDQEADLVRQEQAATNNITYTKDADLRLFEVEAIEVISALDEKIEALQKEKQQAQVIIDTKLKERDELATQEAEALRKKFEEKRRILQKSKEKQAGNQEIFQKVFNELKHVSESHAIECRETISSFIQTYQDIASKVDAIDNGSKPGDLLQDLSNLIEGSEANSNSVSNDSFVLEIPQVHFQSAYTVNEFGHFVLHPAEEKPQQFTWGRSCQKGWYVANVSGLSNQLIAVVSRKKGSKDTYLDIIMHNGDQLTSHKVTNRSTEAFHFVCAVSSYRVATCCESDVSLMNIDNGTVEVSCKLNRGEEAWNISYNKVLSEILVGIVGTNELRVFDETLKPVRTIMMQSTNRAPLSLAATGCNIFVCTYESKAFVLDGEKGTVKTTFHETDMESRAWRICCDSLDMVYVMWLRSSGVISVTRYSLIGEPLSSLDADCNVRYLSFALIQNGSEQLILATEEGEFFLQITPSKVEDAMVRAVGNIEHPKALRVMSMWKPV